MRAICMILCTALLLGGSGGTVHVGNTEIENATMIIGTHLIHIDGLTDELYAIATESASTYNQMKRYYKSELADGRWYEITNAVSIADITTGGIPVNNAVIEALEFTHSTGSDGITRDLRTGEVVNLFDIRSPYDLETLAELEPIRLQYQKLSGKETKTPSDTVYQDMMYWFFKGVSETSILCSDETSACDRQLDGLQAYKENLIARQKSDAWVEITDRIMGQVDARRRYESLQRLLEQLEILLQYTYGEQHDDSVLLGDKIDFAKIKEDNPAGFAVSTDITDAVGQAIANIQSSIAKYGAKLLTQGTTFAAQQVYQYSNDLINSADSHNFTQSDIATEKLLHMDNILSGKLVNQAGERKLLEEELVDAALSKYLEKLALGVNVEYQSAAAQGASLSSRTGLLAKQKADTDAARLEYQTLLEGLFLRMSAAQVQEYTAQLIDAIPKMRETVPDDDVRAYHLETVEAHLQWLQTTLAQAVADDNDTTQIQTLRDELDALEKQRQGALDQNDLAREKRLLAEQEALQRDIEDINKDSLAILDSAHASESDKAKALANLSDKSAAKTLNTLADEICAKLRERTRETDNLAGNMLDAFSGVSALDPDAADTALERISDTLANAADTDLDENLKNRLEQKVGDLSREVSEAAKRQQKGVRSALELAALIEELTNAADGSASYSGISNGSVSDKNKAGILIALSMYAKDTRNTEARMLAASLANQYASQGNIYIFEQYDRDTAEYMSLKAISNVLHYRYIFDDANRTITLSKEKKHYTFDNRYIAQERSKQLFDAQAHYIESCRWAAVKTGDMLSEIERVYQLLTGGT